MRNSNIEFFRFILMIAICVLHLIVHGLGLSNIKNGGGADNLFLIYVLPFFAPAVNCFMLISGYYGIKLSFEKIARLSFLSFSTFCLVMLISYWSGIHQYSLSMKFFLMHIFPISTKVWWFLTEYVCVMLVSPFINAGVDLLNKKQYGFILSLLLFVNSFGLFINKQSLGSNFLSLLLVYMIGRYIKKYTQIFNLKKAFLMYLGCLCVLELTIYVSIGLNSPEWAWLSLSYNNPFIIAQSIFLLFIILKSPPKNSKFGLFLGANALGIYLFTEKFGKVLYEYWAELLKTSILLFSLSFIVVIFFSLLLNWGLTLLFNIIKKHCGFLKKEIFMDYKL